MVSVTGWQPHPITLYTCAICYDLCVYTVGTFQYDVCFQAVITVYIITDL